jgi:Fe-S-cluster containining protein
MNPARPPFARTTCACPDDVANCKTRPGMLMPSDIARITDTLLACGWITEPDDIRRYLRATPGAKILMRTGNAYAYWEIPTISPATTDGHRCVFLSPDDRCQIHEVAPAGCAFFDAHHTKIEGQDRSLWIHQVIDEDDDYHAFRSTLQEETRT